MTDTYLAIGKHTSQKPPLVSLYWDYQNIPSANRAKDLLIFAGSQGSIVNAKVYDNWNQRNKKDKGILVPLGFECIHVPQPIKNAVDFDLFGDCYAEAANSLYPHIFIIATGDGYSEILLAKLRDKGKKVIIVARKGNDRKTLKTLADQFHLIDELPMLINSYKLAA